MKKVIILSGLALVFAMTSCSNDNKKENIEEGKVEKEEVVITTEMNPGEAQEADSNLKIVDDFYTAITGRDSAALISLLDKDVKMYGTDPSEDWNLEQTKDYISEMAKETSTKAVFKVKNREVHIMNEIMYVVDVLEVSNTTVPFRCVTITKKSKEGDKIMLAEFSALVKNEDMKKVAEFFK